MMYKDIKLLKNNMSRDRSDLEWVEEFYNFLQGVVPDGMLIQRGHKPKMTKKKAMSIICYLQEHMPVIPDHFEMCWCCGDIFDTWCDGLYWKTKGRHYCGSCMHHVPENYDRGRIK